MKKTIIKYAWAALLPFVASCSDEWDEHYGQGNPMASEESLWQALQERPELSNFARLVENVGYEYYFGGDRMFTLFAPTTARLAIRTWLYAVIAILETASISPPVIIKASLQNLLLISQTME